MIVIDANILIYAYDTASLQHDESRAWLQDVLSGMEPVGLPWQCVAAFLRVMTNPRLHGRQYPLDEAVGIIGDWMANSNVRMLTPADDHWSHFRRLIVEGRASGPLISDAEIAALTIEYGGVLHTADRDFARFPGLRWLNPLAS